MIDTSEMNFYAFIGGMLVGAFFSHQFRKFRFVIFIIGLVLGSLGLLVSLPQFSTLVLFGLGMALALWLLRDKGIKPNIMKNWRKKRHEQTTFGTSKWASQSYLQNHESIKDSEGLFLGLFRNKSENNNLPMHYTGDRHLLTVAPTRAGKGVSSIIPNLLTYEGSALVIDPKGENALITSARRGNGNHELGIAGMGQDVHILDPWHIVTTDGGSCFNPFDWLNPDDEDINENAMMLADAMIVSRGDKERFFDDEAKALCVGFILYIATEKSERMNRNLPRLRDMICSTKEETNDFLAKMLASSNRIVQSTAARTISKEDKLRNNVFATLQAHTHFLDSPRIRRSLMRSDFKFEDLKTSKMTVYLVLPADRLETFGRWMRLMVQQAITVNARNIAQKPDKPILFLLDEMAALGRLTMIEQAYGLMAGFGMQLWGIVQDLGQLERIYDKGWETFIGNSGVLQYFGSRDLKTAEYFSKLCGVVTTEKFSWSNAVGKAIGNTFGSSSTTNYGAQSGSSSGTNESTSNNDSENDTENQDIIQRPLIFPDELMVMRRNECLVLVENLNPIRAVKVKWYESPLFAPHGINLHPIKEQITIQEVTS